MTEDKDIKTSVYEDDGSAPAGWVHADPTEEDMPDLLDHIAQELSTELGFLDLGFDQEQLDLQAGGNWEWEEGQRYYVDCPSWFIANKCRQYGGSAMLAVKKTIRGILTPINYNAILTSYKKEEAVGKVDYVRTFLTALPPRFKKKIIRDPHHLIEFENVNKTRVKIISHAQKPIRGINGDIGLDELAFYQIAEEVYNSALPAVAQVNGDIDIISTPFGRGGLYYEIFTNQEKYPQFERLPIMWWHAKRYLKVPTDEFMVKAMYEAPKMTTEERVRTFGNRSINMQFDNSDLETFRQEFEGFFVDEQAAFFSRNLIMSCMYGSDDSTIDEYNPIEKDFNISIEEALEVQKSIIEKLYNGVSDATGKPVHFGKYSSISNLFTAVRSGEITPRLIAGGDIGTSRHSADYRIIEEVILADGKTLHVERYSKNEHDWDLPDQEDWCRFLLRNGVVQKMGIDATGLGMQMAQSLEREFPTQFKGYRFSGSSKIQDEMMSNLKNRMSDKSIAMENDKLTLSSLYSIQRIIGPTKSISYKADEKKRHHADTAWAFAIGSFMGEKANSKSSMDWGNAAALLNKRMDDINNGSKRPDLNNNRSSKINPVGGGFNRLGLRRGSLGRFGTSLTDAGSFIQDYED